MASDKIDYKKLEKVRGYIRDFYINGYKTRHDFKQSESISDSAFSSRTRSIEFVLSGISDFSKGNLYRLMFDQSEIGGNPFHAVFKYKSAAAKAMQRYFVVMSALNYADDGLTTGDLQESVAFLCDTDEDFEEAEKRSQPLRARRHSAVADEVNKLISLGIVRKKNQRCRIIKTDKLERLLCGSDFLDFLMFYTETAPFSVTGSFITDKLYCDGAIDAPKSMFIFKDRFIAPVLDSSVMLCLLEAITDSRAARLDCTDGSKITCVPLCFFVSLRSGREYLFYFDESDSLAKSVRLDNIEKVKRLGKADKEPPEKHLSQRYWSPPFNDDSRRGKIRCVFTADMPERLDEPRREKRGEFERLPDKTSAFTAETNDLSDALFFLRRNTGYIKELECDDSGRQKFIDDIDAALALYGE